MSRVLVLLSWSDYVALFALFLQHASYVQVAKMEFEFELFKHVSYIDNRSY